MCLSGEISSFLWVKHYRFGLILWICENLEPFFHTQPQLSCVVVFFFIMNFEFLSSLIFLHCVFLFYFFSTCVRTNFVADSLLMKSCPFCALAKLNWGIDPQIRWGHFPKKWKYLGVEWLKNHLSSWIILPKQTI